MRLIPIRPENVYLAMKDVKHWIEKGLEYTDGKYDMVYVQHLLATEMLLLWVVYNDEEERAIGCLLTEVLIYPKADALSIFLLAGADFSKIVLLLDDLKAYARKINCATIEFYGRDGWEKTIKPFGFEKTHIVMRLNL